MIPNIFFGNLLFIFDDWFENNNYSLSFITEIRNILTDSDEIFLIIKNIK